MRRVLLLGIALLSLAACGAEAERQWYKPGGTYTIKEFERDQAACTKNRVLDEECLKERGWVPLSADRAKPTPAPEPGGPRGRSRY